MKVYSPKQSMTSCGSIKTKMYKWGLTLATLWYKIEDHQDLSSSWKWRIFTFSSTMKCKSLQIYFVSFKCLRSNTHVICAVIDKIKHRANRIQWGIAKLFYIYWWSSVAFLSHKVIFSHGIYKILFIWWV